MDQWEQLALSIVLTAIVPGLLVGLYWGRASLMQAITYGALAGAAGFGGAMRCQALPGG
jgi:Na+(H+)/acetate symporter ActP